MPAMIFSAVLDCLQNANKDFMGLHEFFTRNLLACARVFLELAFLQGCRSVPALVFL